MEIELKSENINTLIQEVSKGISTLSEGPLRRWNEKRDLIHAMNLCKIIKKAHAKCGQSSTSLRVDSRWLLNVLDACKTESDEEMQSLWASVLAREANTPGTLSRRTINRLSDFDKRDAELFTTFCGFCWEIENITPFVFNFNVEIYNKHGINFETLSHLDTMGLIHFERTSMTLKKTPKAMSYYGKRLDLSIPEGSPNAAFYHGHARLTTIGEELFPICGSQPVDGFYEYVKRQLNIYLPADERESWV